MNAVRPYAPEILEEIPQTVEVDRPARWQLIQDRTQMRTEMLCTVEEPHEWVVRVFQLLHMGKETARLDRIQEVQRRSLAPFFESRSLRQSVESVVDLDSIEVQRVMGEPASLGQLRRIKLPRQWRYCHPEQPIRILQRDALSPSSLNYCGIAVYT